MREKGRSAEGTDFVLRESRTLRFRNPESRIPNPESRIPNPESRIPNPESRIPNPESRKKRADALTPTPLFILET